MIFRITGVRIIWVQLYNKLAEKLNKIVFLLYLLICDENLVERERERVISKLHPTSTLYVYETFWSMTYS